MREIEREQREKRRVSACRWERERREREREKPGERHRARKSERASRREPAQARTRGRKRDTRERKMWEKRGRREGDQRRGRAESQSVHVWEKRARASASTWYTWIVSEIEGFIFDAPWDLLHLKMMRIELVQTWVRGREIEGGRAWKRARASKRARGMLEGLSKKCWAVYKSCSICLRQVFKQSS
jgi:hypothetical protein